MSAHLVLGAFTGFLVFMVIRSFRQLSDIRKGKRL
jgi:hypothetical protein